MKNHKSPGSSTKELKRFEVANVKPF